MKYLKKGWALVRLEEVCDINPRGQEPIDSGMNVSFVPMPAVSDKEGVILEHPNKPFSQVAKGYTRFVNEDVIFAKITPCMENGKIAVAKDLVNGFACGSTEFHVLRSNGSVLPEYIWYFLRQKKFRVEAERSMTGAVGQRRVPTQYLKDFKIPIPPINEQRRIVAKLDSLLARSRCARGELARVPQLVERYKQAVLEHALNGDWIPVRERTIWRKACIASVVESLFDGPFGSNLKSSDYVAQGKRVVRLENVAKLHFVIEKETYISQEKFDALKRHMLLSGDVIISSFIDDSIRVCLLPESLGGKAINKADCFCARTNSSICLPEFLAYKMASNSAYKILSQSIHGATRPRINLKALKEFCFLLPTIREQEIIIKQVSEKFAAIDKMASEVSRSYCLLDHLDQATLVKAFRGDLVPQDPNDEPASALLERLKSEASEVPKPRRGRKPKKSVETA